jgi:hypothetical protein
VRWVAYLAAFLMSGALVLLVWDVLKEGDGLLRFIGVLAILVAAVTIAVPVLHRMSGALPAEQTAPAAKLRFCVACGRPLEGQPGVVECPRCGARFRIEPVTDGGASADRSEPAAP